MSSQINPMDRNTKLTPQQVISMENLRLAYMEMYQAIEDNCPNSRERSLALTNLEQSQFWSSKAITHNTY